MSGYSEIEEWQRFLKVEVVDRDLTTTERKLFLTYFEGLSEEDFSKAKRRTIANRVFPEATDPENSAKGHLRKIYKKFGLWTEEDERRLRVDKTSTEKDNYERQKAKSLFDHLKREFQRSQKSRETSSLKLPSEHLNSLLMSINYSDGRALFDSEISKSERMKLFFLEISGSATQKWLVDRLIAKNDLLKSAYRIVVTADSSWKGDENAIWRCILDDSVNEELNDRVVERICRQVGEKTVMLIVFGIDQLRHADIKLILSGFWARLKEEIAKKSGQSSKRCLFLLVGEPAWVDSKVLGSTYSSVEDIPAIFLPPWTSVTSMHLEDWFEPEDVLAFCERESGKSRQELYDVLEFRSTGCCKPIDSPANILDTICYQVLKTKGGLAELEQYWRIAS